MIAWLPPETAPKDGSRILVYVGDWLGSNVVTIASFDEQESVYEFELGGCAGTIDGWLPLSAFTPPAA